MGLKHGGRVKWPEIDTKSEKARRNIEVILEFFGSYLIDKAHFYSLWVAEEPVVITPFVTTDVAVCGSAMRLGWDNLKSFFDPIHDEMHGKFDWTINEFIVGENPDIIVTKSGSDVDVTTGAVWGNKMLAYQGRYIQIFTFARGKIKSFEEYYDTAFLNAIYGG